MPKKKKKRRNGHRIGGAFENKIKKLLISTFEQFGITPVDAFRSVMSGGHKDSYGDISISSGLARLCPYAIECKHWARIDLYQLLVPWHKMGKANKFKEWWAQTIEGAAKSINLHPLLVFRSKGRPIMCMLYAQHLTSVVGIKNSYFRHKQIGLIRVHHDSDGELFCFRFDVLLKLLVKRAKRLAEREEMLKEIKGKGHKHEQISSVKRSGVRLRSQNSGSRKQVQKSSRPPRKASSNNIRSVADKRK